MATRKQRERIYKIAAHVGRAEVDGIAVMLCDEVRAADGHRVAGKCSYHRDLKTADAQPIALIEITAARDDSQAELLREARTFLHEVKHARDHLLHGEVISEMAGGSPREREKAERLFLRDEGEAERAEDKPIAQMIEDGMYWLLPSMATAQPGGLR